MNKVERAEFLQKVQKHGRADIWRKVPVGRQVKYVTNYQSFNAWRAEQNELVQQAKTLSLKTSEEEAFRAAVNVLIATQKAIMGAGVSQDRASLSASLYGPVTVAMEELSKYVEVVA